MNPTPGDVHVNTPLTNISIAMMQNAQNFVATRVFPNIPVLKQSDRYYVYDRGDFNRDDMVERAPATPSAGGGYKLDNTPTYFARKYSFHKDIPDEVRANADAVLNVDREAVSYCTYKALIRREKVFVANYFSTGVWGTEYAGAATTSGNNRKYWSDTTSTPIEDVRAAKTVMLQSTGYEPNKLVLGRPVFDKLMDHPEIIDRMKYGQAGVGSPAMANLDRLAALFNVDEILVMNAIENTAAEGQANSHAFIGGKHALLTYSTSAPGLMTPTAGYTFSWTGLLGSGNDGNRIKTFRMEDLSADRVEIDMCFDMKLVSNELGIFFNGISQ